MIKIIFQADWYLSGRQLTNEEFEELVEAIANNAGRTGTNLQSFWKHKTIEFRYFSSTIKNRPHDFIKWICYFLLIPAVASKRNRVSIGNFLLLRKNDGVEVKLKG